MFEDPLANQEGYRYYQPSTPLASDETFLVPATLAAEGAAPLVDDVRSERDIVVHSDVSSSKISAPDTALTAFCQLLTWRLGVQRAMISVIDAQTQYFIAESTKTVDLTDTTDHAPGDEIWMGCSSVTKAGRLCERTIEASATIGDEYPCFTVKDLSQDERFNNLPFVTGPPFLRFYAGVPLITKRGISIGSMFVVDDKPRNGLDKAQIQFMNKLAGTAMRQLEMSREVEQHRRGMKMSRGLASFVEGRVELLEAEVEAEYSEGTRIAGRFETDAAIAKKTSRSSMKGSIASGKGSVSSVERKEKEYNIALSRTEEAIMKSADGASHNTRPELDSVSQQPSFDAASVDMTSPRGIEERLIASPAEESEASSMRNLFSRAANLIREAFEVDGGAVFYDAQTGFNSDLRNPDYGTEADKYESSSESHADSHPSGDEQLSPREQQPLMEEQSISTTSAPPLLHRGDSPGLSEPTFSYTTRDTRRRVEVLGFSTSNAASINNDMLPGINVFTPFHEKALQTLLRRYSRGKLWTFDSDGAVSSSSEEEKSAHWPRNHDVRVQDVRKRRLRSAKSRSDANYLSKHFPGVRQLLFVPLWDAGKARWLSGCFVWSTDPTRVLSRQGEMSFLTAFGNSVMAEWARLDTEIADQKKGDFIGSVSHELRSPLHGILASAEFLEEVTSGWERQLVETIDSCGRTLLDTINHILDFSKINHFERNWRRSKKSARRNSTTGGPLSLRQSDLPMLNLFQEVDISIICEEVIESVFAGHTFQNVTAQSFDQVAETRGKMSDSRKAPLSRDDMMGPQVLQHVGVGVILDIGPQNFNFTTQPGALRRLIMNLLGNALKYTMHGFVRLSLHCTDMESLSTGSTVGSGSHELIPRSMVTLTVTDTGKGISPEFLRSKLFMPFAQENSLSNGTGLGLSIVRKIVSLLEGEITIDSEVGRGTQVKVTLPLLREMPKASESSGSTNKSVSSAPREVDQAIFDLRSLVMGQKVVLHGFEIDTPDPIIRQMNLNFKASVTKFLVEWYGMKLVPLGSRCNLIVTNEANRDTIFTLTNQAFRNHKVHPAVITICSYDSTIDRSLSVTDTGCNVGYVSKPVGPLKLAKSIKHVIDGAPCLPTPSLDLTTTASSDLSNVFEELSLGRSGGEILDNTRIAAGSDNARKAIESPTPNAAIEKNAEFPFPPLPSPNTPTANKKSGKDNILPDRRPETIDTILGGSSRTPTRPTSTFSDLNIPPQHPQASKTIASTVQNSEKPTMLLVDDNAINITLLATYFKKRAFTLVHEAVNGLEAVQKFEARPEGYDIIFMDITMPVLDGFGATKQIRAVEASRRGKENKQVESSGNQAALIIAFTGRSSIEDQTEAVRVGIDLFMTKPVAFKEVGKIIENWMANRQKDAERGGA